MSLVEQELLTIPEHLDSSQVISRVRVTPSLVFWVVFLCSFFLSDIVLLVLRFKASDYLFGIFWLLLWCLLITSLVSSDYFFGIFWLLLWYLQTFLTGLWPLTRVTRMGATWELLTKLNETQQKRNKIKQKRNETKPNKSPINKKTKQTLKKRFFFTWGNNPQNASGGLKNL